MADRYNVLLLCTGNALEIFASLPFDSLDRPAPQHELRAIGSANAAPPHTETLKS